MKNLNQIDISRNDLEIWCFCRETSIEVGMGIFAIETEDRRASDIWLDASDNEKKLIREFIRENIKDGNIEHDEEDKLFWGVEQFNL